MGIALGKKRVCDVGIFFQSSSKPTQLSLGNLSLVKDLTMKRSLAISYISQSRVGVVPLMSPWQTKPVNIVTLKYMACRLSPFDSCPWGRRMGCSAVLELQAHDNMVRHYYVQSLICGVRMLLSMQLMQATNIRQVLDMMK